MALFFLHLSQSHCAAYTAAMEMTPGKITGSFLVRPRTFADARGYFRETWNRRTLCDAGLDVEFVQDNFSRSTRGVLRGLHYQMQRPQGKLVWVVEGEVFDVLVDLRQDSPTFGAWDACRLTATAGEAIWIPPGCAHGFLVLSEAAGFCYKCSDYYAPQHERTLRWNDPALGIDWPALLHDAQPVVSDKDAAGASWRDCEKYEAE